ncbi:MAG: hypothetical protein Q8Q08_06240 [Candidatus Omnitrophota bacterium]|nr:hypothetical protein [Candidatus Omnitrophota bacterium]MDZ4241688.1 hypothetical protein [Candidatus Omnitrophota bacterium]
MIVRRFSLSQPLMALAALCLLGFLIYGNSLQGEFCSDDYKTIVNNPAVKRLHDLPGLWVAFNTRFLAGISFAVNYHFHGLNVQGYHAVNVFWHVGASFLVFWLVRLMLQALGTRSQGPQTASDLIPSTKRNL